MHSDKRSLRKIKKEMAVVVITKGLEEKINKIFKKESIEVFSLLYSLESNPKKGKNIATIGKTIIKEIKYKKFRFYFITNGFQLKLVSAQELKNIVIKFVRMSQKKDQQKVIEEIKKILRNLGEESF